ncbi:MAG: hypothetical protein KAT05_05960, partial [Spirochaetes bacterium]|nr:hypothetical protein [Spirochaetota bacterium]
MPNNMNYLIGGAINPLNWCIWIINIIIRLSDRIKNENFIFVIIIMLILIIAPLLLDYFIDDDFYKILTYIPIPIVIICSFKYWRIPFNF